MAPPLCGESRGQKRGIAGLSKSGARITISSALNRPFAEWSEVFPNAACVVSLVDRLVHNAEIIALEGDSYRLKEARERSEQRARQRNRGKR